MLAEIVFWARLGVLAWVYVGYPVDGRRSWPASARSSSSAATEAPTLTVAIAVHDEADHIAERIDDALAQDGPRRPDRRGAGRVGRVDRRDRGDRRGLWRRSDPRVRLLALPRGGQTATQTALFAAARGEVVVLTDAETRFAPGCLAALAEALRDPRVGCVDRPARVARRGAPRRPRPRKGCTGATSGGSASSRAGPAC